MMHPLVASPFLVIWFGGSLSYAYAQLTPTFYHETCPIVANIVLEPLFRLCRQIPGLETASLDFISMIVLLM